MKIAKKDPSAALATLTPLGDEALSAVAGGRVQHQDLHVVKHVDKSSPDLFGRCVTGVHFAEATLHV